MLLRYGRAFCPQTIVVSPTFFCIPKTVKVPEKVISGTANGGKNNIKFIDAKRVKLKNFMGAKRMKTKWKKRSERRRKKMK